MSGPEAAVELAGRKYDWPELLQEALTMPGSIGSSYSRFYNYSLGNVLLLYLQWKPEPMATYKRWGDLGRQVQRGAKAKAILRPITIKKEREDGELRTFTRFKLVNCLFGLSETEGAEVPEPVPNEWSKERALGKLALTQIPFESFNGNVAGYSTGTEIAVSPLAPYPLKTTVHECAHCVLEHATQEFNYVRHQGLAEFEAEGTAYLVMNELGETDHFDAAESRAYISGWLRGSTPDDRSIKRVFSAASKILDAGRIALDEHARV